MSYSNFIISEEMLMKNELIYIQCILFNHVIFKYTSQASPIPLNLQNSIQISHYPQIS